MSMRGILTIYVGNNPSSIIQYSKVRVDIEVWSGVEHQVKCCYLLSFSVHARYGKRNDSCSHIKQTLDIFVNTAKKSDRDINQYLLIKYYDFCLIV